MKDKSPAAPNTAIKMNLYCPKSASVRLYKIHKNHASETDTSANAAALLLKNPNAHFLKDLNANAAPKIKKSDAKITVDKNIPIKIFR